MEDSFCFQTEPSIDLGDLNSTEPFKPLPSDDKESVADEIQTVTSTCDSIDTKGVEIKMVAIAEKEQESN